MTQPAKLTLQSLDQNQRNQVVDYVFANRNRAGKDAIPKFDKLITILRRELKGKDLGFLKKRLWQDQIVFNKFSPLIFHLILSCAKVKEVPLFIEILRSRLPQIPQTLNFHLNGGNCFSSDEIDRLLNHPGVSEEKGETSNKLIIRIMLSTFLNPAEIISNEREIVQITHDKEDENDTFSESHLPSKEFESQSLLKQVRSNHEFLLNQARTMSLDSSFWSETFVFQEQQQEQVTWFGQELKKIYEILKTEKDQKDQLFNECDRLVQDYQKIDPTAIQFFELYTIPNDWHLSQLSIDQLSEFAKSMHELLTAVTGYWKSKPETAREQKERIDQIAKIQLEVNEFFLQFDQSAPIGEIGNQHRSAEAEKGENNFVLEVGEQSNADVISTQPGEVTKIPPPPMGPSVFKEVQLVTPKSSGESPLPPLEIDELPCPSRNSSPNSMSQSSDGEILNQVQADSELAPIELEPSQTPIITLDPYPSHPDRISEFLIEPVSQTNSGSSQIYFSGSDDKSELERENAASNQKNRNCRGDANESHQYVQLDGDPDVQAESKSVLQEPGGESVADDDLDVKEELLEIEDQIDPHHVDFYPPCFRPETPLPEMALQVLAKKVDFCHGVRSIVLKLVESGQLSFAYYLNRAIETADSPTCSVLPGWLLQGMALGQVLTISSTEVELFLEENFGQFSDDLFAPGERDWNRALRFYCLSAVLPPALLMSSSSWALQILKAIKLKDGLLNLNDYCQKIIQFRSIFHKPLDLKLLADDPWLDIEEEEKRLRKEAEVFFTESYHRNFSYGLAKSVWKVLLAEGELVNVLINFINRDQIEKKEQVQKMINHFSDESAIRFEIEKIEKKLGFRNRNYVQSHPLKLLTAGIKQALGLAEKWLKLKEYGEDQKTGLKRQIWVLRGELTQLYPKVVKELKDYSHRFGWPVSLSIIRCLTTLKVLNDGLTVPPSLVWESPKLREVLNADLLKVSGLQLDEAWNPEVSLAETARAILEFLAQAETDWKSILHNHFQKNDFQTAKYLIEYVSTQLDEETNQSFSEIFDEKFNERLRVLGEKTMVVRREIESAVHSGLIGVDRRADFIGTLETVEQRLKGKKILRFEPDFNRLEEISLATKAIREDKIRNFQADMKQEGIGESHSFYRIISQALAAGDFHSVNEYIRLASENQPLPSDDELGQVFFKFFPQTYSDLSTLLNDETRFNHTTWIHQLKKFSDGGPKPPSIGPIDMRRVAGKQAGEVAEMLEAWFDLKQERRVNSAKLTVLFKRIGFSDVKIEPDGPKSNWVKLQTAPIQDRDFCLIPAFGSQAKGKYRVYCAWDRPTEDELFQQVSEQSRISKVIILYFGRMSEQRRRDLARTCRERGCTFLVIDEVILLHSCPERGSRLPVIMATTLPFTFYEPFVSTASVIPPEMFYGRQQEIRDILEPNGASFIYGGRQLGKTVLLRKIEEGYHAPQKKFLVKWVDLKTAGIGINRNLDDFWDLLLEAWNGLGGIDKFLPKNTPEKKLLDSIQDWVNGDSTHRFLLLLDEADKFLIADGEDTPPFKRVDRLKQVMDATNWRFKVVFAGLHNVLRTTKLSNNTLAHFGTGRSGPICIGPLLENGEHLQARALVERPFAALGYKFESQDLVTYILSQTNYYPSLIQVFCFELLRHVTNTNYGLFDDRTSPPYTITRRHLEEVNQSKGLQESIRQRFLWTLHLDERYAVIAYSMAYEILGQNPDARIKEGFTVDEIKEMALLYWSEGFHESSYRDAIKSLLDEMIGLGVLRKTKSFAYTLRSPNLLLLMGKTDDIWEALLTPRQVPAGYDPGTFRSVLEDSTRSVPRRNPLTAQQMGKLQKQESGVSLIFGSQASGLEDLLSFLKADFRPRYFESGQDLVHVHQFKQFLESKISDREKDATVVLFVPSECPWTEAWVEEAEKRIQRLSSRLKFVRVVFVADPDITWELLRLAHDKNLELSQLFDPTTDLMFLEPWHDSVLQYWLDDCRLLSNPETRKSIYSATGNWPYVIQGFWTSKMQDLNEYLKKFEDPIAFQDQIDSLRKIFGLSKPIQLRVLNELIDWPMEEDLSEFLKDESISCDDIRLTLQWAECLRFISPRKNSEWEVDLFIKKLLRGE